MLEGLTVLSTEHIVVTGFGWCPVGIVLASLFCFGLVFIIAGVKVDSDILITIGFAITIPCFVGTMVTCSSGSIENEYNVNKVVISDEVDFNEFYNKYCILSFDGNIYEIVEWGNTNFGQKPNSAKVTVTASSGK